MKRLLSSIVLGAVIATTTVTMTGCPPQTQQVTLERTYFEMQEAYIGVVRAALGAQADGIISVESWHNDWNPIIQEGDAILDDLYMAYASDSDDLFNAAASALQGIMNRLTTQRGDLF